MSKDKYIPCDTGFWVILGLQDITNDHIPGWKYCFLSILERSSCNLKWSSTYLVPFVVVCFFNRKLGLYSLSGWMSHSLAARSIEVSKPRDSGLDIFQLLCRDACQISEQYEHYDIIARGFEISADFTERYARPLCECMPRCNLFHWCTHQYMARGLVYNETCL